MVSPERAQVEAVGVEVVLVVEALARTGGARVRTASGQVGGLRGGRDAMCKVVCDVNAGDHAWDQCVA